MDTQSEFYKNISSLLEVLADQGIHHAAEGLATMMGQETLLVTRPEVRLVPLTEIPSLLGGPENEAVGIYLRSSIKERKRYRKMVWPFHFFTAISI